MLGMCVFFWGSGYKLSLYNTHQPNLHRIPAAKLLSKNEDPNATDGPRLSLSAANSFHSQIIVLKAALLAFFWTLAGCLSIWNSVIRAPEKRRVRDPRLLLILGELFFRPPPIHSVL